MTPVRWIGVLVIAGLVAAPAVRAQEIPLPKPGPEHEVLKKLEGTWDATAKGGPVESKGTMVWKMDLNGLWLKADFDGTFGDTKFHGYGMDSYDPVKKKYVGVWIDSMSTSPLVLEGTYDKEKKTLTMSGEGPGMDGKPTKYRTVTEMKDNDNVAFQLFMADQKDPMMTITYKRKK
jgi:hypothetical protein